MNIRHPNVCTIAMVGLVISLWPFSKVANRARDIVPRKRLLTIPIALAAPSAKPASSLACEVAAGPQYPYPPLPSVPMGEYWQRRAIGKCLCGTWPRPNSSSGSEHGR